MSWEPEGGALTDTEARRIALTEVAIEVRAYVFALCVGPDGLTRSEATLIASSFQLELMRSRGILPTNP